MAPVAIPHQRNREALASDMADVLTEHGCTAETALALPEAGWALVVSLVAARRGRPVETPSTATISLALFVMSQRENLLDPFDGLPS